MHSNLLPGLVLDRLTSALSGGEPQDPILPDDTGDGAFLEQLKEMLDTLETGGEASDAASGAPNEAWVQWAQELLGQGAVNLVTAHGNVLPARAARLVEALASMGTASGPLQADAAGLSGQDGDGADLLRLLESLRAAVTAQGREMHDPATTDMVERLGTALQASSSEMAGIRPAAIQPGVGMQPLAAESLRTPTQPPSPIPVPVDHARWGDSLGQRVVWMVNQDAQSATLQLSPRELGPVGVQLTIEGEHARLSFVAHHAPVREAIEAALPRLREMLGTVGLVQVDVNVSQHGSSRQDPGGNGEGLAQARLAADSEFALGEGVSSGPSSSHPQGRDGLVDIYI